MTALAALSSAAVSFDAQAVDFDRRAGLPDFAVRRIAAAVAELAPAGGGLLLDVGAGTGLIGEHLAHEWGRRRGARYLGVDLSGPMLAVFRRRLGGPPGGAALLRADAGVRWPVADGSVRLIFLSRAAHLLPPAVLVAEAVRVASRGGAVVVFGCARTPPDSLRAVVRRRMRRLLAEHAGVEPRRAKAALGDLADALVGRGGEVLPVVTAASWPVVHRARDSVAAWRAKQGLGGRTLAPEVQEEVLCRLEEWIRRRYGGLDVTGDAVERYELAAIRWPRVVERNPGERDASRRTS